MTCLFMASPSSVRGGVNRLAHLLEGAATADIGDGLVDVLVGRLRLLLEQRRDRHDHAALAIAALRNVVGDPGLLHLVQRAIAGEAFDGGDLLADGFADRARRRSASRRRRYGRCRRRIVQCRNRIWCRSVRHSPGSPKAAACPASTSTLIVLPLIVRFAIAFPLLAQSIERTCGAMLDLESGTVQIKNMRLRTGRKLIGRCCVRGFIASLSCSRCAATARRRKLIRLPSAANPAPSASAMRRAVVTAEGKAQRRERGAEGLSGQARGRDDAARAAAAMRRRARHQRLHVGRLKEAESDPADHHAPDDVGDAGIGGKRRQQRHADAEQRQTDAAENADRDSGRTAGRRSAP